MIDTREQLAASLKELRIRQGHSIAEVAKATDMSKSFVSLVESGRSDITIGRLLRLVTFYGAKIDDLLPRNDTVDPVAVRKRTSVRSSPRSKGSSSFCSLPTSSAR